MKSRRLQARRATTRALVAVVLLAGVFAMHGLTGNHDAAMAMTDQMPASVTADAHSATVARTAAVAPPPGTHRSAVHQTTDEVHRATQTAHSTWAKPWPAIIVEPGHGGHSHRMVDVCLAMLVALLLALVVALTRRGLTEAHPVELIGTAAQLAAGGLSPPCRRPTLSKLCVLRT